MKCPACGCSTPVADRCRWCSKPILDVPREASLTERERNRNAGHTIARKETRYTQALRMSRQSYMDQYLARTEAYMTSKGITPGRFGELVGVTQIVRQLREGNSLRPSTRAKLDGFLRAVSA